MVLNVKKRVVQATKSDLITLLSEETVHMSALSETAQQELKSLGTEILLDFNIIITLQLFML